MAGFTLEKIAIIAFLTAVYRPRIGTAFAAFGAIWTVIAVQIISDLTAGASRNVTKSHIRDNRAIVAALITFQALIPGSRSVS